MNKLKKCIFFVIIIIIALIIIIINLNNRKQTLPWMEYENHGRQDEPVMEIVNDTTLKRESNRNRFFTVRACVNKFYRQYGMIEEIQDEEKLSTQEIEIRREANEKAIGSSLYNMLDMEYIEYKGLTEENIFDKLNKIEKSSVDVTDIYVSEKTESLEVYVVEGTLRENGTNTISNIKNIVKLDTRNGTFSILLQDYVESKYKNAVEGQEIDISTSEIKLNSYNKIQYIVVTDDEYINELQRQVLEEIRYNTSLIYNKLDEEYKNTKFKNLQEFNTYVSSNVDRFKSPKFVSFNETKTNENKQYIFVDNKGYYYILQETEPMKYTLILDTYTIDIPEFTEKYEKSSDREKVVLNLNKINLAINDKDYKYAYNKLADSFKANNFPTLDSFETYAKTNFFSKNKFEYLNFGSEAQAYYTYNVNITDSTKNIANVINKTFIMQLGENTDFKFSFNK